jgi:hypothetical protein
MHVRIVEARDDGSPAPVDYARLRAPQAQNFFILAHSGYLSRRYGDRFDKRRHPVRGDFGVVQYEFSRHTNLLSFSNNFGNAEAAPLA